MKKNACENPSKQIVYTIEKVNMSHVTILKIIITKGPVSLIAPQKNMR